MSEFHVHVRYVDRIVDMDLIEPGDCSVISLINDTKKHLSGCHIEAWETWQLRVTFPWNGQQHVLTTDKELMLCFEMFTDKQLTFIEFELLLVPIDIQFPEDAPALLGFNQQNVGDPVEEDYEEDNYVPVEENCEEDKEDSAVGDPVEENCEEDKEDSAVGDAATDESDVDNDYEVDEDSEDSSDVSLLNEDAVSDKDHCDHDGDERNIVVSSDEENALTRIATYCQNHQWAPNPNGTISFEAGQILGSAKITREVVKKYAIQEGFTLKKIKNDRYRYTVTCKNDACDWRLHASCLTDGVTFIIRSVKGSHSMCPRLAENKEATSRWVASVLGNFIRSNRNGKAKLFKNELQERFAVKVDSQTIYRAKRIVLETLKLNHIQAYAKLKRYGNAILTMNPMSDVKVEMDPNVLDIPTFFRFYLSFDACKKGFVKGCRPLIGIDGCHLSGKFGGVLLSATALDGDNNILPIAICICESENFESWSWFLRELRDSLGWDDRKKICFISDRQKGCVKALATEWPEAYTRYCFRHIVANFMATFKNHNINWKLWQLARVANHAGFNQVLDSIKEDSEKAANWMMKEPVEKWARHAFEPSIKADHVSNNMSECFNSWIRDDRDKPILQLLENLRRKIMVRFSEKWAEVERLNDIITPYAREYLTMNEKEARKLQVIHGRGNWYETIDNEGVKILVNLGNATCDCGMWQINGLPCTHAVAVFMYNREFAHNHVHWFYSKQAWQLTYEGVINPIPEESRWPEFQSETIQPPVKRTKVGRPKKKRTRPGT